MVNIGQRRPNNYMWLCDSHSFLTIFYMLVSQSKYQRWKHREDGIILYRFWKGKYRIIFKIILYCAL